jgi:O-antigen ligase
MAVVPLLWGVRYLARGRLTVRTPLDWPLAILLVMLPVSLWATFDPLLSFPKLCGVFIGIALFYALTNALRTERAIWLGLGLLLLGGVTVAAISLVGTRWSTEKVPLLASSLSALYDRLPALLRGVPRAEQGFSPNQVGGTLTLFIPLSAALLAHRLRRARLRLGWLLSLLALAATLALTVAVLLLTQSRLSYASAALGLLLLGVLQRGWPRALALAVFALGIGLVAYLGFADVAQAMFGLRVFDPLTGHVSGAGRLEIWRRALRVIRDHPLTGIGFDALFPVMHARYPTFLLRPGSDATHAHNLYLQVALDLGLPGLLAFLWLLVALARMLWQVWRGAASPATRALALGLLCGGAAQLLFGVADAIALGQKPGIFLWATFGLGAALWAKQLPVGPAEGTHEPTKSAPTDVRRSSSVVRRPSPVPSAVGGSTVHCLLTIYYRPLLLALVLLLLVGWGARVTRRARGWASLVRADLAALQSLGQDAARGSGAVGVGDLLHQTRSDLRDVQAEFALPLTLAENLGWLPRWGADVAAIPRLLRVGLLLSEAGEQTLEPLQPFLESRSGGATVDRDAQRVVAVLQEAEPQLEQGLELLDEARAVRQGIRVEALTPRLAEWVAQLDRVLPLAENGLRGALALPELLGASGPRTVLILVQNEDELRPTGGFISGVARVTLQQGKVTDLVFEDSYAVDDFSNPYPDPPQPLREIMAADLWVFRDANWSPDFPTSARQALELYRLRYDVAIDGVIALDQRAVQLFLTAFPPLEVPGYPEPVTAGTAIEAARRSWAPAPDEGATSEWWVQRKDFMGHLLTAAVVTLQERPESISLSGLARAAMQALQERHLLIHLPPGDEAAAPLHEAGWDGALRQVSGDYLMVVDANLGFNKVNPYVREAITYTVDLRQPERPQVELTLAHSHRGAATDQPCRHQPRYDLTYEGMMQRCYWDYLRVYVPAGSSLLDATPHPVSGEWLVTDRDRPGQAQVLPDEAGKGVFATFFVLPPGERVQTTFRYALPATALERSEDAWRYRLTLQKQPGTAARDVIVRLILPRGAELVSASPRPTTGTEGQLMLELSLRTDVELAVRFRPAREDRARASAGNLKVCSKRRSDVDFLSF